MIDALWNSRLLSIALMAVVAAMCGCDAPQQKPAPSVTQTQRQPEPQAEEQAPQDPAPQQAESEYLPPSDDAADVEVTEIPTTPQATSQAHEQDQQATAAEVRPAMNIGGAETDEERAARLENKLDSELSEFDGMMRDRRAALEQAEHAAAAGAPSGVADGRGFRTEGPQEERGAGGRATVGTGQGNTPDLVGEERRGDSDHVAIGPVPDDIPNERDDDIVARQLREAAMKETDPVLREKLWDEYRKYKKGLRSQ
jgi:hypothetical protein